MQAEIQHLLENKCDRTSTCRAGEERFLLHPLSRPKELRGVESHIELETFKLTSGLHTLQNAVLADDPGLHQARGQIDLNRPEGSVPVHPHPQVPQKVPQVPL